MTGQPEMVERLARLICRRKGINPDARLEHPTPVPKDVCAAWELEADFAREILAAIREPTQAMSKSARPQFGRSETVRGDWPPVHTTPLGAGPDTVWRLMVDAAGSAEGRARPSAPPGARVTVERWEYTFQAVTPETTAGELNALGERGWAALRRHRRPWMVQA